MSKNIPPHPLTNTAAAIITGGSSGIGKAFIELIYNLAPGAFICNLSRSKPNRPAENQDWAHFPADLSREADTQHAANRVIEAIHARAPTGPLLLVNNSGFGKYGPFPEPGLDPHLRMVGLNARAPVHLTGLLLPLLRERGGGIINVASTAAFQPTPFLATYGATKAFLMNWSLALSFDLRGQGIHVLCLCPGPTRTNFFRHAGFDQPPLPDAGGESPEQVVRAALRAYDKGKYLAVSGFRNKIMAASASFPLRVLTTRISAAILKQVRKP